MKFKILILVLTSLFYIASCNTQSAGELAPTSELSTTHTQIPPTQTKTSSPPPSPTPTATQTQTPFATPTIEPTLLSKIQRLEEFINENQQLKSFYSRNCILENINCWYSGTGLSPDKEWTILFDPTDNTGGLRIINFETLENYKLSYLDITDNQYDTGSLRVEHWSADGQYLYLSPQVESSGGDFWFWRDDVELICLDLTSGVWVHTNMGPAHAFSPDDGKIVYRSGNTVVVRNLRSGEEFTFPIPSKYVKFGDFVWSEDSRQILFVASMNAETDSTDTIENAFTIYQIAMDESKLTPVLEKDPRLLHPIVWVSDHEALLAGFYDYSCKVDALDFCDELYLLDLSTGNIKEKE